MCRQRHRIPTNCRGSSRMDAGRAGSALLIPGPRRVDENEEVIAMRLRCPYCQRATEVPGALEGITVKCNACGRVFVAYSFLEDKRTADRIEIELPCRINGFEGRTIDLSMTGLSTEVPGFRGRPKMSADIRIHMPNRDEPLTARGDVARRPRP